MDVVDEVIKKLEKKGLEKLSDHRYGLAHPFIGKPCLYRDSIANWAPAIPYGAHKLSEDSSLYKADPEKRGTLLAIAYFDSHAEGLRYESLVNPDDLIPVDSLSKHGQKISHIILSLLVDNILRDSEKKKD